MKITKRNGSRIIDLSKREIGFLKNAADTLDDISLVEPEAKQLSDQVRSYAAKFSVETTITEAT